MRGDKCRILLCAGERYEERAHQLWSGGQSIHFDCAKSNDWQCSIEGLVDV